MKDMMRSKGRYLLLGDVLVLAVVTVVGFARHGELGTAGFRTLTTFVPLIFAWLLVSPHLDVFSPEHLGDMRQLWRPFWAMVLAGPMAGFLRGVWLGTPVQAVFVVVLGGVSALALTAWHGLYGYLRARGSRLDG